MPSVTESLEDSASGKLVEGILASIAEFYSANPGQEIRKGMDQKAAQGGWPVQAPFGYRNVRTDGSGLHGGSVLEAYQRAPLVAWAFERYATGQLRGRPGPLRLLPLHRPEHTGRTRCSQGRYVPAAELEREVEALYERSGIAGARSSDRDRGAGAAPS